MGGQQFEVDLGALTDFQHRSDRGGEGFDKIVGKLEAARVGRESFGVMPGSGEIFAGYEERVNSCLDSLKGCAEAIRDLGGMVADCGEDYEQIDAMMASEFGKIATELEQGAA